MRMAHRENLVPDESADAVRCKLPLDSNQSSKRSIRQIGLDLPKPAPCSSTTRFTDLTIVPGLSITRLAGGHGYTHFFEVYFPKIPTFRSYASVHVAGAANIRRLLRPLALVAIFERPAIYLDLNRFVGRDLP